MKIKQQYIITLGRYLIGYKCSCLILYEMQCNKYPLFLSGWLNLTLSNTTLQRHIKIYRAVQITWSVSQL